ncbi:MAG: hypothetical protein GY813_06090, partial [Halieaceae bacterium]|nr:hypothetical protein [Halieaceae bacterium]
MFLRLKLLVVKGCLPLNRTTCSMWRLSQCATLTTEHIGTSLTTTSRPAPAASRPERRGDPAPGAYLAGDEAGDSGDDLLMQDAGGGLGDPQHPDQPLEEEAAVRGAAKHGGPAVQCRHDPHQRRLVAGQVPEAGLHHKGARPVTDQLQEGGGLLQLAGQLPLLLGAAEHEQGLGGEYSSGATRVSINRPGSL